MIFPFAYGEDKGSTLYIPENQTCCSCDKKISRDEKSIEYHLIGSECLYFHVACAGRRSAKASMRRVCSKI
jgi:hypothetical protein